MDPIHFVAASSIFLAVKKVRVFIEKPAEEVRVRRLVFTLFPRFFKFIYPNQTSLRLKLALMICDFLATLVKKHINFLYVTYLITLYDIFGVLIKMYD